MTATTKADSDDGYQHWAEDGDFLKSAPASVPGYDTHNGFRSHIYNPTYDDDDRSTIVSVKTTKTSKTEKSDKTKRPDSPKSAPAPPQPQVIYTLPQYQYPQMMTYQPGPMQYTYAAAPPQPFAPPMGYAMPPQAGYYGYPGMMQSMPMVVPAPEYKAPKAAKWQGRTKKQVEEDNMKIAAREGACEKRKVQPVGVKDEQMMWCVEPDGSTTLRTFVSIKELAGEWKQYPQYEDAWYFLRDQEKKED